MGFQRAPKKADADVESFLREPERRARRLQGKDETNTSINTNTSIGITPDANAKPWEKLNPKAASNRVFNLRLNDYWFSVLQHVGAQDEDKSIQKLVKEILLPELKKRLNPQ